MGSFDSNTVGLLEGAAVGLADGLPEGAAVGMFDGGAEGKTVGVDVVGRDVGPLTGSQT